MLRRNMKRLTPSRKRKIEEFKLLGMDNPNLFGSQGSDKWIQGLLTHLNEPGVLSWNDVLEWLATEEIREYFHAPPMITALSRIKKVRATIKQKSRDDDVEITSEERPSRLKHAVVHVTRKAEAVVSRESDKAQDKQASGQVDDGEVPSTSRNFYQGCQLSAVEAGHALGNEDVQDNMRNEEVAEPEILFEGPRMTFNVASRKNDEIKILQEVKGTGKGKNTSEPEKKKIRIDKPPSPLRTLADLTELARKAAEIVDDLDKFDEPIDEPDVANVLSTCGTSLESFETNTNIMLEIQPGTEGNNETRQDVDSGSGSEAPLNTGSNEVPPPPQHLPQELSPSGRNTFPGTCSQETVFLPELLPPENIPTGEPILSGNENDLQNFNNAITAEQSAATGNPVAPGNQESPPPPQPPQHPEAAPDNATPPARISISVNTPFPMEILVENNSRPLPPQPPFLTMPPRVFYPPPVFPVPYFGMPPPLIPLIPSMPAYPPVRIAGCNCSDCVGGSQPQPSQPINQMGQQTHPQRRRRRPRRRPSQGPQEGPELIARPRSPSPADSMDEFIQYAERTMNDANLCGPCARRRTTLRRLRNLLRRIENLLRLLRQLNQPLFQDISVKMGEVHVVMYEFARRFQRRYENCRNCNNGNGQQ